MLKHTPQDLFSKLRECAWCKETDWLLIPPNFDDTEPISSYQPLVFGVLNWETLFPNKHICLQIPHTIISD